MVGSAGGGRLQATEVLFQHGVTIEPIAHDLKHGDNGDDVADLEQDLSGLKTSPSSAADHVSPDQGHEKLVISALTTMLKPCLAQLTTPSILRHRWFPYYKEVSCHIYCQSMCFSSVNYPMSSITAHSTEGPYPSFCTLSCLPKERHTSWPLLFICTCDLTCQ